MWSDRALRDLGTISRRGPRAAYKVRDAVLWLVSRPFPGMYRRVKGRAKDQILVVDPYIVIYRIDGDTLTISQVADGRRRREEW